MKPKLSTLLCLVIIAFSFGGCNFLSINEPDEPVIKETSIDVNEILERENIIPILKDTHITLVDTNYGDSVDVYELRNNEVPSLFELHDIQLSPSRKYIVWYSPLSGLLSYNIKNKKTTIHIKGNEWLNQNPYFELDPNDDVVYIIDNEGTEFYQIDLQSQEITLVPIPFPFGNAFKISPNLEYILFISGFGQTEENPEFMYTSTTGEDPIRFSTDTPLNRREEVVWLPDSSGVLLLSKDADSIDLIPYGSESAQEYYKPDSDRTILRFEQVNNLLYYQTNDNWWHVIDMTIDEEIARMPKEVVADIHNPYFLPWPGQTFLIEETINLDNSQFNRLWKTNFTGTKELLVDSYNEITVTNSLIDL